MDEKWIMFEGTNYPEEFGAYLILVVNTVERGGRPFIYMAYCGEAMWHEEKGRVFYTTDSEWGDCPFEPHQVIAWRPLPSFDEVDWEAATLNYWAELEKKWRKM